MSAIAALLSPPKVTHIASRLVVSGKTVTSAKELPPLPDASARQEIKKKLDALCKKKLYERKSQNPEFRKKRSGYTMAYNKAHPEGAKRRTDKWRKDHPEQYLKIKREGMRRLRERKKQCLMQAMTDTAKQS